MMFFIKCLRASDPGQGYSGGLRKTAVFPLVGPQDWPRHQKKNMFIPMHSWIYIHIWEPNIQRFKQHRVALESMRPGLPNHIGSRVVLCRHAAETRAIAHVG